MSSWHADSWKDKPHAQDVSYDDPAALAAVVAKLKMLPPLVTSWEVERLKEQVAEAQAGKRFILQGGDCAETLFDCQPGIIANKLKILLQMSLVLIHAAKKPVVRVGRLAIMRGLSRTSRDVPPFALMDNTHEVHGVNRVGMRRAGLDMTRIRAVDTAFRMLFRVRQNLSEALVRVEQELGGVPEVAEVLAFIRASKRGVATAPRGPRLTDDDDEE